MTPDAIIALQHISSALAVYGCVWMIHAYRLDSSPANNCIAAGLALLAIFLTATAFGRFLHLPFPGLEVLQIGSKLTLAAVLATISFRREFLESGSR